MSEDIKRAVLNEFNEELLQLMPHMRLDLETRQLAEPDKYFTISMDGEIITLNYIDVEEYFTAFVEEHQEDHHEE
jgi:hypothetical protein